MPPARRELQLRQLQRAASGKIKRKPVKPKAPAAQPAPRKVLLDLPTELLARIAALLPTAADVGRLDCVSLAFHGSYIRGTSAAPGASSAAPGAGGFRSVVEEALRLRVTSTSTTAVTANIPCGGGDEPPTPAGYASWAQKLLWEWRRQSASTAAPIGAGAMHCAFIDASGTLLTCGIYHASTGFLGHGSDLSRVGQPTAVPAMSSAVCSAVSARHHHTLVLCASTGHVYACGRGDWGRLGNGTEEHQHTPELVEALVGIRVCGVAAGRDHSLFLDDDGRVFSCGATANGRLGHVLALDDDDGDAKGDEDKDEAAAAAAAAAARAPSSSPSSSSSTSMGRHHRAALYRPMSGPLESVRAPRRIDALQGVRIVGVAAGDVSSFFVSDRGHVYSCGCGESGMLGHGDREDRHLPMRVESGGFHTRVHVRAVAAGRSHALFADADSGDVYSCGSGALGALGHGDDDDGRQLVPRRVDALAGQVRVTAVGAGEGHSLFVCAGGRLFSCGWNANGQLGHGDYESTGVPRQIEELADVVVRGVCAGCAHSLAHAADGRVYGWGNRADEYLGLRQVASQLLQSSTSDLPMPLEYPHLRVAPAI
jgi:alpha-tubulin suppressor-like RCC1 family protein